MTEPADPGESALRERWGLVLPHYERLLRIGRRKLPEGHAADYAHEAMARCVAMRDVDDAQVGPLLTTIMLNLCADFYRHRLRDGRVRVLASVLVQAEPGPDEQVCDRAEAAWLARRIDTLPKRQRAMVAARAEGLSFADVAARFDVSYTAVESAVARARTTVRRALDRAMSAPWIALRPWLSVLPEQSAGVAAATAVILGIALAPPVAGPHPVAGARPRGTAAVGEVVPAPARATPLPSPDPAALVTQRWVVRFAPPTASPTPDRPRVPTQSAILPGSGGYVGDGASTYDEAWYCLEHPVLGPPLCREPPPGYEPPIPEPSPGGTL